MKDLLPNNFGVKGYIGNPDRLRLNHPLASMISYFAEPTNESCFELAFFIKDTWVTEIIPEFSSYAELECGETRVYRFVPSKVLHDFLDSFSVK